jgi:hypothetical protein
MTTRKGLITDGKLLRFARMAAGWADRSRGSTPSRFGRDLADLPVGTVPVFVLQQTRGVANVGGGLLIHAHAG